MAGATAGELVEGMRGMNVKTWSIQSASNIVLVKSCRVDYALRAHRRAFPSTISEGFCKTSNNVVHLVRDMRLERVALCSPGGGFIRLSKGGRHLWGMGMPARRIRKGSAHVGGVAKLTLLNIDEGASRE